MKRIPTYRTSFFGACPAGSSTTVQETACDRDVRCSRIFRRRFREEMAVVLLGVTAQTLRLATARRNPAVTCCTTVCSSTIH
jgi:hypothetical protein